MSDDKIMDIDEYVPHFTGELICIKCKYRYIGTWREDVWLKDLYCPKCNQQRLHNWHRSDIGDWRFI